MKIVAHPWWVPLAQIGAATLVVIVGLCLGAAISALLDWIIE